MTSGKVSASASYGTISGNMSASIDYAENRQASIENDIVENKDEQTMTFFQSTIFPKKAVKLQLD